MNDTGYFPSGRCIDVVNKRKNCQFNPVTA